MEHTTLLPDRIMGPRRIAVVPSASQVPDKLDRVVDEVVLVDGRDGVATATAYQQAFTDLRRRLDAGELSPDDLVVTLPVEGSVDVDVLDDLQRLAVRERLDALLVRRDLSSGHPRRQKLRSALLSAWATLWAGRVRLHDTASCHRVFRLAALADAMAYCRDERSTGAVELAVVLSRLGCRVRNDVLVAVPLGRSRYGLRDALAAALDVPAAAFRVESNPEHPGGPGGPAGAALRLAWPLVVTTTVALSGLWLVRFGWRWLRGTRPDR
jgi:hypothetical protein